MKPDNPACYECPKGKSAIHTWQRRDDGTAHCLKCKVELTKPQADDVWRDHS